MTTVEMKRNFKEKLGYTRVLMIQKYNGEVKYKRSLCYPAAQNGKFVEYTQNTYEMTREEANAMYLKLKKQGFTSEITK
jgi:hypothetical protein